MIQNLILKNGIEITVERLTVDQVDEILELQQTVIDALTSKSVLEPLSRDEFLFMLNGRGLMIGAYYKEELIAFRAMLEPELDEEHLGKDAGLLRSEWPLVLYSEITNVNPKFRGNNVQVLLGEILMDEVDKNRFRYICATVAPFNIASLKDKFAHGMYIVSLKIKYGDLLRYILMKDLSGSLKDDISDKSRYISMADTEEQQQLIQSGWVGTGIEKTNEKWVVRFEKQEN